MEQLEWNGKRVKRHVYGALPLTENGFVVSCPAYDALRFVKYAKRSVVISTIPHARVVAVLWIGVRVPLLVRTIEQPLCIVRPVDKMWIGPQRPAVKLSRCGIDIEKFWITRMGAEWSRPLGAVAPADCKLHVEVSRVWLGSPIQMLY